MIFFWILFLLSFFSTLIVMPHSINQLEKSGNTARDMYKREKPHIATNAGMIIVFTSFITISLSPLLLRIFNQLSIFDTEIPDISRTDLAMLLVISIYALYGLIDDLLELRHLMKLLLPISFGYPLVSVMYIETFTIPFLGVFDLNMHVISDITTGDIFKIIVIPIYVMVCSNLINMHSGYNGLQSGLSITLLATLLIKSSLDGILQNVIFGSAFLGSMLAFFYFNMYPSSVFEGNIGSLLFGSIIGSIIVIQEYWWFGFFILIPHTLNFLLWIVWLFLMKFQPDKYLEKGTKKHTKFGKIRDDGSLHVPNILTLKWIPNYYLTLSEKKSTWVCYSITLIFCFSGLLLF